MGQNVSLGQLLAIDDDKDDNGIIVFDIVTGDTNRFRIMTTRVNTTGAVDDRQIYAGQIFTNEVYNH